VSGVIFDYLQIHCTVMMYQLCNVILLSVNDVTQHASTQSACVRHSCNRTMSK